MGRASHALEGTNGTIRIFWEAVNNAAYKDLSCLRFCERNARAVAFLYEDLAMLIHVVCELIAHTEVRIQYLGWQLTEI